MLAWLAVAGILALFTLALTWIAVIPGLSAKSVDGASAFSYPLIFLPFISSAFVPTETMPGPVRVFAENQPVTSIVNAIRDLFAQQPVGTDIWVALAWCVGILVVAGGEGKKKGGSGGPGRKAPALICQNRCSPKTASGGGGRQATTATVPSTRTASRAHGPRRTIALVVHETQRPPPADLLVSQEVSRSVQVFAKTSAGQQDRRLIVHEVIADLVPLLDDAAGDASVAHHAVAIEEERRLGLVFRQHVEDDVRQLWVRTNRRTSSPTTGSSVRRARTVGSATPVAHRADASRHDLPSPPPISRSSRSGPPGLEEGHDSVSVRELVSVPQRAEQLRSELTLAGRPGADVGVGTGMRRVAGRRPT